MTRAMRRLHKWLGLAIGLQWLLWAVSGLAMSLLDADKVRGRASRAAASAPKAWPADTTPVARLSASSEPVLTVTTGWLLERPVYRLASASGTRLLDARTGEPVTVDAPLARRLAQASYAGAGQAGPAEQVPRSLETRAHAGKVWRVAFSDEAATTVYLSLQGEVLEHRNRTWRVFDVFWMLHIMDYRERQDFNHPLLAGMAIGALGLSLSGLWLLCTRSGRAGMVPGRRRPKRSRR
ncbi:PepSY domain-containing protein [Mitsuaria sp. GD03876]|uniref:PepSY domain-containing protein n=1 Tax=Mitsuaria sp. GD03876 TaxID=2975399 RepID=UPI00244B4766|nr:PepSY domain-containing protein [Mitsuaria sp. GD03876]MDH0864622.1 PepSY domain-containing protein [Mitsuaria sp. GD03876]